MAWPPARPSKLPALVWGDVGAAIDENTDTRFTHPPPAWDEIEDAVNNLAAAGFTRPSGGGPRDLDAGLRRERYAHAGHGADALDVPLDIGFVG